MGSTIALTFSLERVDNKQCEVGTKQSPADDLS